MGLGCLLASAMIAAALPVHGRPQLVAHVPSGGFVSQMATADFNGDGLTDLVVTRSVFQGQATFPITILLNNGRGGFRDGTAELFSGVVPETQNAREIVIADFNGDRRPDIFIADHGDDEPPYPGCLLLGWDSDALVLDVEEHGLLPGRLSRFRPSPPANR